MIEQTESPMTQAEELVSIVAHDLRNPLSCIEGYAGMLLAKDMPHAERVAALGRILSCSRFMEQIIEDLLDTAAIERGDLEVKKSHVLLMDLLRKALDAMEHSATSRRVMLSLDSGDACHAVLGDSGRIRQVVQNLVSNAIKHVEPGAGRVEVKLHELDDELVVEVADDGEGIAPEDLERVFEKFFQADTDRARGSLGLGLHIARRIVELHGGRLWARSAGKGKGAAFYFSLPKFQPEQALQEYKARRRMATPPPRRVEREGGASRLARAAGLASRVAGPRRGLVFKVLLLAALAASQAALWRWTGAPRSSGPVYSASTAP